MDDTARTGELRRRLEKDPGSRLFAQLAEELRKEGKLEEAISVARKGLEKNPNYPSARLTLARALLDSGRPKEARPELEQIVRTSPDNIMASRLLGDTLDQLGDVPAALAQFERTLRLAPGDKAVGDRIAELKSRASRAAAPAPPPTAAPPRAVPSTPAPHPSVFAEEPPAPALPPPAPPSPPEAPSAPSPFPSVFSEEGSAETLTSAAPPLALDRDLASGTLSPGQLNTGDIMRELEGRSGSTAATAPGTDADATLAFGALQAPSASEELPATLPPSFALPPEPPAPLESPAASPTPEDLDPGGQTLPLTSLTLADLYLQQGLKAEASAVLSQVLKEEPENEEARSKLAAVSSEASPTARLPEAAPSASAPVPAPPLAPAPVPAPPAPPVQALTKPEIRERTIASLRAFVGAVEREAVAQKATERGTF